MMKKLLFVFLAGAFAACNSGGSGAALDSTSVSQDTVSSSMSSGSSAGADTTKMNSGADTGSMSTH